LRIPYFLSLDRKKVAKKDQGQPETLPTDRQASGRLSGSGHTFRFEKYFRFGTLIHQGSNAEVTEALRLNQGK